MDTIPCPYCGKPLTVSPGYDFGANMQGVHREPTRQTTRRLYHADTLGVGAVAGGWTEQYQEAIYEEPARAATPQSDVVVPLFQSSISGLIVALLGAVVCFVQKWPWYVAPVLGLITLGLTWLWLLQEHRRSLWKRERYIADNPPPAQSPAPETLRVELTSNPPAAPADGNLYSGGEMRFLNLPVSRGQLAHIAQGGYRWSIRGLAESGLSQNEAKDLLRAMLTAGLLEYPHGQPNAPAGADLTPAGRAIIRKVSLVPKEKNE